MSHIYGSLGHWEDNPFRKMFGGGDDELKKKYDLYTTGKLKCTTPQEIKSAQEQAALLKVEMEADETHQQQQLMKIAAEAGASGGGTAVSQGGPRMPYGDTAMFNPKAMPQRYIPGTKPREEDELIPPGLFSPYRMYR